MAEPTRVLTPEPSGDALVYRPLSGLAIAGLALSLVYTVMVVVSAAAALIEGAPFFLAGWTVLLAVAGAGLSLLARWRIRTSEGTRAGLKVAQWGLWLSVVSGLGYTAYAMATAAAIKQQANRFLTEPGEDAGFFPHLQKGEVNAAFLLTQTPSRRSGSNPGDDEKMRRQFDTALGPNSPTGMLTMFADSPLVRLFEQARLTKDPVTVEPAAVRGWGYEAKGYKVERTYSIGVGTQAPEVTVELLVTVKSVEAEGTGAGRKWFVDWSQSYILKTQDSPAGLKINQLRWDARGFVDAWLAKLNQGQRAQAFLDTLDAPERAAANKHLAASGATRVWALPVGLAVPLPPVTVPLDSALADRLFVPGFDQFLRSQPYLKAGGLRTLAAKDLPGIRADFERAFQEVGDTRQPLKVTIEDPKVALWEMTGDGRLQISHRFQIPLVQGGPGLPAGFLGKGRIVVHTPVPGDPRRVEFTPAWRLVSVELDRAVPTPMSPQRGRP
jgi:hypothetical protein